VSKYEKSSHHVIPSSCSKFGREVILPKKFHSSWHSIFGNLYGREIELFVEEVNSLMDELDEITNQDLAKIRERIKSLKLYEFQKKQKNGTYKRR
jgi:ABC-type phosphate transport system auxiliary subunit